MVAVQQRRALIANAPSDVDDIDINSHAAAVADAPVGEWVSQSPRVKW